MASLTLIIGDKALSTWSLRAWLALKATGAPFAEVMIRLDRPDTTAAILAASPSGRVPALKDGGLTLWDSLAIGEYLAERFPEAALWPADPERRAVARSISAEMHAGFAALRRDFPMMLNRPPERRLPAGEAAGDIARIVAIWQTCRGAAGADGPFLFGRFTLADAMYAPVAFRFAQYWVDVPPEAAAYRDALLELPAMQEWQRAGAAER